MELADGGDLFDKIEADVGVGEDVAHFYFRQLMSAVSFMHSKGVAHRDLKPENMLLSGDGDLKLADFGLAALFMKDDQKRKCSTMCGSPPYMAPEVVAVKKAKRENADGGYYPNISDTWSCGVVLFVLLVGNTPWDEPTKRSYEFCEYIETEGRPKDELWQKIPQSALSLLRGMLKMNPAERFGLEEIRRHPWFTRPNPHLSASGRANNPVMLATQMIESLRIDFNADPLSSHSQAVRSSADAMDIDPPARADHHQHHLAATQPETPLNEMVFDWEMPPRVNAGISASQPMANAGAPVSQTILDRFAEDPCLSQFTQTPSVPMSLTQQAKKFNDIMPGYSLTRFISALPFSLLLTLVQEAVTKLNVPTTEWEGRDGEAYLKIKTVDGRMQGLNGRIQVEQYTETESEVRFVRVKGDPLEWRRFFKKMAVLCKDGVIRPEY